MMSLLPSLDHPRIVQLNGRAAIRRAAGTLDAICVLVREDAADRVFDELPEPQRWRDLRLRSTVKAGDVRTSTLANSRQTLTVLGFLRARATVFETLALAGRVLKETTARKPATLGVFAPGHAAAAAATLEALVQAALAHAFALPSFRAKVAARDGVRTVTVPRDSGIDLRYVSAVSRANN